MIGLILVASYKLYPRHHSLASPQENNILVVETPSLAEISPATLSRFPLLFVTPPEIISPYMLVEVCLWVASTSRLS